MKTIGNILWFIFGGLILGLSWFFSGVLWCVTIVGIPWGRQCFKFAKLAFWPFGREIVFGGGFPSMVMNVLWIIFSGLALCVEALTLGCVFCVTIVGIPFGLQCFKFAKLALMPYGATIRKSV